MTFSLSRLIHKKWLPLEDIEARDLKFCMGPYFTHYTCCTKIEAQSENFLKNWYSLIDIYSFYSGVEVEVQDIIKEAGYEVRKIIL